MNDEQSFLAAICSQPADDTVRLVYADWLDERGQAGDRERAEFIRVQCELARLSPAPPVLQPQQIDFEPEHGFLDHDRREGSRKLFTAVPLINCRRMTLHCTNLPERLRKYDVVDVAMNGKTVTDLLVDDVIQHAGDDPDLIRFEVRVFADGRNHYPDRERRRAIGARERELLLNFPAAPYWRIPATLTQTHPHRDVAPGLPAIRCHGYRFREVLCLFARGFVESVTCTAEDWLAHADAVYWHPEQTVECSEVKWRVVAGTVDPGTRQRSIRDGHPAPCPPWCKGGCNGTGRIPRPFVATAQPITHLTLTTLPSAHVPDFNALRSWVKPLEWGGDLLDSFAAEWPHLIISWPTA
jgi:uncharacterized protein (TIGR02996 family)